MPLSTSGFPGKAVGNGFGDLAILSLDITLSYVISLPSHTQTLSFALQVLFFISQTVSMREMHILDIQLSKALLLSDLSRTCYD